MRADYVDHMGDDLRVVNAARVSFDKQSETFTDKDGKLIGYLSKHGHWTPFAHPMITLRETVPIFVARQRFKHMVGFVYNEVSRRYVSDTPEFYSPPFWYFKPEEKIKQGRSDKVHPFSPLLVKMYENFLVQAEDLYNTFLSEDIAPEQARILLPQSMYTSYYVTGSLSAFGRAYNLRSDPNAMMEIRELASQWDEIIRPLFPVAWEALVTAYAT